MGKVHIVGAGPGDPELITLKGFKLLQDADLVVYAGSLVNRELLKFCRKDAILVNSHGKRLEELVDLMAKAALEGKKVVRLATGDPAIYSSLKEMKEELDKRGVKVEVVPGVSSLAAGAASLKEELTVPEGPQSVVITRLSGNTPVRAEEALERFAATGASIAIFLSINKTEEIRERCLRAGLPPETPVAIVYKASWKEERIIETTLDNLKQPEDIKGSAIVYILPGRSLTGKRSFLYSGAKRQPEPNRSYSFSIVLCGDYARDLVGNIKRAFPKAEMIEVPGPRKGLEEAWKRKRPILFIGPVGVAVRLISPLLKKKEEDPPLLVLDVSGSFVVVVTGGHHGGNRLAKEIARAIGAVPVITTGTEATGKLSLEELSEERGFTIISGSTKRFNSLSIKGKEILVVGMGWRRGISTDHLEQALDKLYSLVDPQSIAVFAVPYIKKEEAMKTLAPLIPADTALVCVPDELIQNHPGPSPSRAKDKLNMPGASEPCALSIHPISELVIPKQVIDKVTFAVACIGEKYAVDSGDRSGKP